MAKILSKPPKSATSGERSFYNRIESVFNLKDEIIVYFEPEVGGLRPDFLLLSPEFGVLIVEVKDYSPNYLKEINKSGKWEKLDENNNAVSLENPFDQLYQYWRVVQDRINFSHLPPEIRVPVTQLAVLSEISKDDLVAEKVRTQLPQKIHLCFKETLRMSSNFEKLLLDILPSSINLEAMYFQTLRANIVPTCRLPTPEQADLMKYFTPEDQVKLLDKEQEHLARKLGDGHRLIFGVAGSGKTVVLIAHARFLALRHPDWKILVLCYNKTLKNYLFQLFNPQDYSADITINTFHGWARQYILSSNTPYSQLYTEADNKAKKENNLNDFFQIVVPSLFLQMINDLKDGKVLYDAILIDEGQDFEADWFRIVSQVLNTKTNSLLITCDGLQGIYDRKQFRWSDVGIQAIGRTKKFEKCYRTPIEIGTVAQEALPKTLRDLLDKFDEFISTKVFSGNHGIVELIISESRKEESERLAEKIATLVKQPQEVIVVFKRDVSKVNYDTPFFNTLKKLNVEWQNLTKYNYKKPGLLIGTIHSTKGLEFDTIVVPELDSYGSDSDRQLLYVGIMRSRKRLILSAAKSTDLVRSLMPLQTFK